MRPYSIHVGMVLSLSVQRTQEKLKVDYQDYYQIGSLGNFAGEFPIAGTLASEIGKTQAEFILPGLCGFTAKRGSTNARARVIQKSGGSRHCWTARLW